MRNYGSRFPLPNGKWAYIQLSELAEAARLGHIPRIQRLWRPPKYFYHLRPGGHVTPLHLHRRNAWFGKVDLSSFFNRVSRQQITRHLKKIGYSYRDAEHLAIASTVWNPESRRFTLPYGFVQSPLLASVALDTSLLGRCLDGIYRQGVTLTVYVDDIIVSCGDQERVREALQSIRAAAARSHFPVNEAKSAGPLRSVQAFNVELQPGEMQISAGRFEDMCGDVLRNGPGPSSDGILSYVRSVSPRQAGEMLRAFPRSFPGVAPGA